MLLIYNEESAGDETGPEVYEQYRQLADDMRAANALILADELQETSSAKSVRVRNGEVETTDGSFAQTKEALGGYFLVECDDLDQALGYAARIPGAAYGTVEVRPLNER